MIIKLFIAFLFFQTCAFSIAVVKYSSVNFQTISDVTGLGTDLVVLDKRNNLIIKTDGTYFDTLYSHEDNFIIDMFVSPDSLLSFLFVENEKDLVFIKFPLSSKSLLRRTLLEYNPNLTYQLVDNSHLVGYSSELIMVYNLIDEEVVTQGRFFKYQGFSRFYKSNGVIQGFFIDHNFRLILVKLSSNLVKKIDFQKNVDSLSLSMSSQYFAMGDDLFLVDLKNENSENYFNIFNFNKESDSIHINTIGSIGDEILGLKNSYLFTKDERWIYKTFLVK